MFVTRLNNEIQYEVIKEEPKTTKEAIEFARLHEERHKRLNEEEEDSDDDTGEIEEETNIPQLQSSINQSSTYQSSAEHGLGCGTQVLDGVSEFDVTAISVSKNDFARLLFGHGLKLSEVRQVFDRTTKKVSAQERKVRAGELLSLYKTGGLVKEMTKFEKLSVKQLLEALIKELLQMPCLLMSFAKSMNSCPLWKQGRDSGKDCFQCLRILWKRKRWKHPIYVEFNLEGKVEFSELHHEEEEDPANDNGLMSLMLEEVVDAAQNLLQTLVQISDLAQMQSLMDMLIHVAGLLTIAINLYKLPVMILVPFDPGGSCNIDVESQSKAAILMWNHKAILVLLSRELLVMDNKKY